MDVVDSEGAAVDHVEDTAGRPDDQLHAGAELVHVLPHVGAADARHRRDTKVITDGHHDLDDLRGELARGGEDERLAVAVGQVDVLEQADGEGRRLAGARLRLGDGIAHNDERLDRTLLDGRRLLRARESEHGHACGEHISQQRLQRVALRA